MSNNKIDFLDFIEKCAGVELMEWQREYIKSYKDFPPISKIVMGRDGIMRLMTPTPEKETMEDKMIKASMIKAALRKGIVDD